MFYLLENVFVFSHSLFYLSYKHPQVSEYDSFLRAKDYLKNKGWHPSSDGGCGIGGVFTIRTMYSFPRISHTLEPQLVHKQPKNKAEKARLDHIRMHPKVHTELTDGPLIFIYKFYCLIQPPGSKVGGRPDFQDIKECNHSLSFLGMISFLRDFDFVPKYILSDVSLFFQSISMITFLFFFLSFFFLFFSSCFYLGSFILVFLH